MAIIAKSFEMTNLTRGDFAVSYHPNLDKSIHVNVNIDGMYINSKWQSPDRYRINPLTGDVWLCHKDATGERTDLDSVWKLLTDVELNTTDRCVDDRNNSTTIEHFTTNTRQMVRVFELAMEITEASKIDVFVDYKPHVNELSARIYRDGHSGKSPDRPVERFYLNTLKSIDVCDKLIEVLQGIRDEVKGEPTGDDVTEFLGFEIKNCNNQDGFVLSDPMFTVDNLWRCHFGNHSTLQDAQRSALMQWMIDRPEHFATHVRRMALSGTGTCGEFAKLEKVMDAEGVKMPKEITGLSNMVGDKSILINGERLTSKRK